MPIEIERKFLLKNDSWRASVNQKVEIRQGYLSTDKERNIRVRVKGGKGFLTIKGKTNHISRKEFEYEIPKVEAEELLALCHIPLIEKIRYEIPIGELTWEIDEFFGENTGLIIAEIELEDEHQELEFPSWIGKEVSSDTRYFNSSLVNHPFKNW